MPWGNGCDWQGRGQNLAGFNGLPGYQALLAAAPLYCKRSMAFFEPLFALFPDLYKTVGARSIQTMWCGLADAMGKDFVSTLLEPDAAATPFGEHAAPNSFLASLRADKRFPTPAALRDFFVANPDQFNRILHNARPDALEIHDIVQFYFVLLDRIMKYITENPMETD